MSYDPDDERWDYVNPDGTPDEQLIGRLAEAIAAFADPERIVLFGSAARGEMHLHSDIDLLVVERTPGTDREARAAALRAAPPGDRRAVDIILATPAEVDHAELDGPYEIVGMALAEGRTIYERTPDPGRTDAIESVRDERAVLEEKRRASGRLA